MGSMARQGRVGIVKAESAEYPREAPFHPAERYPEYPFVERSDAPNHVYSAVRELFRIMRLDVERYGTPDWNPLGGIVSPGDRVVLKPNFVMDRHYTGGDYDSVVTHGAVIRAILDYVTIALAGMGEVTIADAPMIDNDFDRIVRLTGVSDIVRFYTEKGRRVGLVDLRVENVEMREGLIVRRFKLPGDPAGYVPINLGKKSELSPVDHLHARLRGSDYDSVETARHHNDQKHEYLLSKTVLSSDVFINLPKLKTHKKIGVTLNLKNLIGINGDKNWIPHYRIGNPKLGGDEFETTNALRHMESLLKDRFKETAFRLAESGSTAALFVARKLRGAQKAIVENTSLTKIRAGGWHGNDTIWRSVLDLNKILLYADIEGRMHSEPQRKFLSFVDGIVGGEGDGPIITTPKRSGVIVGGFSPLAVDLCATRLMGFDYRKIAQFRAALDLTEHPLMACGVEDLECEANVPQWNGPLEQIEGLLHFRAAGGWEGHIEV